MRKALLLLLALVFVGALGYAQGAPTVAINGFVETGVAAIVPGDNTLNGPNRMIQYNNDSGNAGRFRLGIAITAPDGNAGFVSRLEGDSGVIGNPGTNSTAGAWPVFFNRFAGWGKLLGGALTIKGGILDESQFWTANRNWGGWLDGAAGLEFLVNAYPGLTVSYYLPAPVANPIAAGFVTLLGPTPTFYAGGNDLTEVLCGSSIQAAYAMPNTVNIVVGYQIAHAASTLLGPTAQGQSGYMWAGVDYVAMPNITARVETQLKNISDSALGEYDFFLEGAYKMDQLKIDVGAWIYYFAASGSDLGYNIEPNVSYDLGYAKVGIVGDIGNIGGIYSGPLNSAASYGTPIPFTAGPGKSGTKINLDIGPYIGVPITTGSSVNAGFLYTVGDLSNDTGTSNGAAIYVDVRYSF